jgi:CRISPR-associated protein Cas1
LVEARARNQRALLRRLLRGHEASDKTKDALARMGRIIRRIPHAESIAELLGLEGRAAALYWPALGRRMGKGFRMRARQRPARDRANIMLNMLAGLLERDIRVAVQRAGLHPGFGALHSPGDRREACVYDLMEEFRAHLAEGLMVWCVNKGVVRHDMFTALGAGLHMSAVASRAIIRAYEARAARAVKSPSSGRKVSWKRLMQEQAFALAAHYEGRADYAPYLMDY